MEQQLLQFIIVIVLVVILGYLGYLLGKIQLTISDSYVSLTNMISKALKDSEATPKNIDKISRLIIDVVNFIEDTSKNDSNEEKENAALLLAKRSVTQLELKSVIDDNAMRKIIKIAVTFLPPTHK